MYVGFWKGYEIEEVGYYDSKTGKIHFYLANGRDVWGTFADVVYEEDEEEK